MVVDTRKALAIVALVAAEGRPFARDELAAMFWPEADDEAARGALRRTLSALRTAVAGSGIVIGRSQVALDPHTSTVDLGELERLSTSARPEDLEAAAALARGPFLAGFALRDCPAFDDWQAGRSVRVMRTVGDVLDRLAAARSERGDPVGAVDAARRRVDLDPLDEVGQRRLIESLATAGDRTAAIRQYRELVALLDRELGVAPLRGTTDLYDAIRDDAAVPEPAPMTLSRTSSRARDRPAAVATPAEVPFVGRQPELATIVGTWRGSTPDGRVVLIEGEAGIGKTRLAETAAATIRAAGGIVLAARGYPGEDAIAYSPIADLLRSGFARPASAERLVRLDASARLELGRLVDLPAPARIPGPTRPAAGDGASARVRLLESIAGALTVMVAGAAPGLVLVDDLHLADDPTREALVYLAHRLAGRPMTLLLTFRREDLTAGGAATADDLARLRGSARVALRPLGREEIATLVRAMRPDRDTDGAQMDAFVADSEGLPLHVVAALQSDEPPGTTPRGVEALLRERIDSVGETAAQVLSAAAVIGRSFDFATVRHASGRSEEETIGALEELMRRGIVGEIQVGSGSPGGGLRYDFGHGRLRNAAYESSSLARRRLLHRRIAEAFRLDLAGAGRDDVGRFALIARHERAAGRSAEASEAYLDAADRAEVVFANREAIEHLEAALALGHPAAADLRARIGELRARLGEYPAAIGELETAAALATPDQLPSIEVALGRVHRRRGDLAAAASHLGAALAAPDLAPALRIRALVERSVVALRADELEVADLAAREARATARSTGDRPGAGVAERLVGLVAQARGDLATARQAFERSGALAADDPDPTAAIAAATALALVLAADGEVDAAVAAASGAIEACGRIGDRHLEAAVENHLADLLHDAGREADAMEHLKRAVALFAEIGEGAPEAEPGIWSLAAW